MAIVAMAMALAMPKPQDRIEKNEVVVVFVVCGCREADGGQTVEGSLPSMFPPNLLKQCSLFPPYLWHQIQVLPKLILLAACTFTLLHLSFSFSGTLDLDESGGSIGSTTQSAMITASLAAEHRDPTALLPSRPRVGLGSMNGTWILDKRRGNPSMRGYLETMGVTEFAIEAHEKGEAEHDTINIIEFDEEYFKIKKISRVTDLELELKLGEEFTQTLPGDRVKTVVATSDCPGESVNIVSRMPTINGMAMVTDNKILRREGNTLVMVQTLVIRNEQSGQENTTVRFFVPYHGEIGPVAITAKGAGLKK